MLQLNFSDACAIPADDGGSVILTGGVKTPRLVTRYSAGGWVEDMPRMAVGRGRHGCSGFLKDNEQVMDNNFYLDLTSFRLQRAYSGAAGDRGRHRSGDLPWHGHH